MTVPSLDRETFARWAPAAAPLALGIGSGIAVQVVAFVGEFVMVLSNPPDAVDTAYRLRLAVPGALGLAVACAVAVRVALRRLDRRQDVDLPVRSTGIAAGAVTGLVLLATGLVVAPAWVTVPVYLTGIALGTAAGVPRSLWHRPD